MSQKRKYQFGFEIKYDFYSLFPFYFQWGKERSFKREINEHCSHDIDIDDQRKAKSNYIFVIVHSEKRECNKSFSEFGEISTSLVLNINVYGH
jgi:hypothetical protein